jgi:hypothetical protein
MSPTITPQPRSWVTATLRAIPGRLLGWSRPHPSPPLSDKALHILDMANQANAQVYEDAETYRSYAVDRRGVVTDVDGEVDELRGAGCLALGVLYGPTGRQRRDWTANVRGRLTLIKAGRLRWPGSAKAGQS